MQYENKEIVDFHNLGLSKKMVGDLNYILDQCNNFIKNKNTMTESIVALINYYVKIIVKDAINTTRKKIKLKDVKETNNEYDDLIENYKYKYMDILINEISNNDSNIDISNLILFYCIKLYRNAELMEFKINNINDVNIISKDNCCELCITKSKFKNTIDELINDIHPFCKYEYNTIIDEKNIKAFIQKMNIVIPEYLKNINLVFLDQIELNAFNNLNTEQIEKIKLESNNIISYCNNETLFINKNKCENINHTILLNMFKFDFNDNIINWFKDTYNNKIKEKNIVDNIIIYKYPFISFIAEINYINYMKESVIFYILESDKLKNMDNKTYEYIKNNIFNNLEFR